MQVSKVLFARTICLKSINFCAIRALITYVCELSAPSKKITNGNSVVISRSICVKYTVKKKREKKKNQRTSCAENGEKGRAAANRIDNPFPAVEK